MRVINDVNSLNDLFTNGIVNVLVDCMTLVLLLVIMLAVNWKLTLISMCIMPLLILILFKLKRQMRLRWQRRAGEDLLHERLSARIPGGHAGDRSLRPGG